MKFLIFLAIFSAMLLAVYSMQDGKDENVLKDKKTSNIVERNKRAWQWIKCKRDKDCKIGFYCSGSYCHPYRQCNLHVHCPKKWECDFTEQVCKPKEKPECFKNRDCLNGQHCVLYQCRIWSCRKYSCTNGRFCYKGKCMFRECKLDSDCKDGQQCNTNGLCGPRPTPLPTNPPSTEEPGGSGLESNDLQTISGVTDRQY